jgi:hypothetical protein
VVFASEPNNRFLSRMLFASDGPQIDDPEWLNAHIGMMDIARDVDGNVDALHGTERDSDAGETPTAPFPLEPE